VLWQFIGAMECKDMSEYRSYGHCSGKPMVLVMAPTSMSLQVLNVKESDKP
jgi:hypothetical protein